MTILLKKSKILEPRNPNRSTALFDGKASGILNWNDIPYPHFYKLREMIRNQFWIADEVDMTYDTKQFSHLTKEEKTAYLKIIGLLASLDSSQTNMAFKISEYTTDPSVSAIMATIADQETEHNRSYAYILSSVTDWETQKKAFEAPRTDPLLLERNEPIVEVYNRFSVNPTLENVLDAMIYTSLLEGLFFYSGFAYFYNLARNNKMVGTSTMISYINKDEMQHANFITELYRATLGENPEYNTEERAKWVYEQYKRGVESEIKWSNSLLRNIDGIYLPEMEGYIRYRANKMLRMLGLSNIYPEYIKNPMKWVHAFVDNFDHTKTDFFEQRSRQYTKTSDLNGFDDL